MSNNTEQPLSSDTMRDYYAGLRDRVADADTGVSTDVKAVSGRIRFAPFEQPIKHFTWLPTFLGTPMSTEHQSAIQSAHDQMLDVMFDGLNLQSVNHAVDVGCGYGTDVLELAARYPHMTFQGHNISNEQIEFARERATKMELQDRVSFDFINSCTDSFTKTYDLAWSFQVVHHQQDKFPLFRNVSNSLVNGGYFVLAEILSAESHAIDHPESSAYFTPVAECAELLSEAGFRVEQAVDASAEIANYLADPDFEQHLVELAEGGDLNTLKHLRGPHDLGRLLSKGFTQYMLLSARKDSMANKDSLKRDNTWRLQNPQPYKNVAMRLNGQVDTTYSPSPLAPSSQATVSRDVESNTPTSTAPDLKAKVAKILEIQTDELEPAVSLVSQGLNSLMAMEIRRDLNKEMGIDIPVKMLLGEATLFDLQSTVDELYQPEKTADKRSAIDKPLMQPAHSEANKTSPEDPVDKLSEAEVDALISRLLEPAGA